VQQICTFRNQFGQSAWKTAFGLGNSMPARAVIRCNSRNAPLLEMDNAHGPLLQWRADIPVRFSPTIQEGLTRFAVLAVSFGKFRFPAPAKKKCDSSD
jgi:hypothetical protein